jgi:hypothetical protein
MLPKTSISISKQDCKLSIPDGGLTSIILDIGGIKSQLLLIRLDTGTPATELLSTLHRPASATTVASNDARGESFYFEILNVNPLIGAVLIPI